LIIVPGYNSIEQDIGKSAIARQLQTVTQDAWPRAPAQMNRGTRCLRVILRRVLREHWGCAGQQHRGGEKQKAEVAETVHRQPLINDELRNRSFARFLDAGLIRDFR
jgi:hypothetical protein